jgi:hypothetical protein
MKYQDIPTMRKCVQVAKTWCSGDHVYGAVKTRFYPSGTVHMVIDGRELPVAHLSVSGDEYKVERWIGRTEPFPEPIKGFNV